MRSYILCAAVLLAGTAVAAAQPALADDCSGTAADSPGLLQMDEQALERLLRCRDSVWEDLAVTGLSADEPTSAPHAPGTRPSIFLQPLLGPVIGLDTLGEDG